MDLRFSQKDQEQDPTRAMKGLHFKFTPGGFYRILFYVEDFYYPVEEDVFKELKGHVNDPPDQFLRWITERLGHNTYLRDSIEQAIARATDPGTLAKTLKAELEAIPE